MASSPHPISQFLLVCAFAAVAASAGLQFVGLSAQAEAARQQSSRQSLAELSSVLHLYEEAPEQAKAGMAAQLAGLADKLARQANGESMASASRRVGALASYEAREQSRERELQERLRAEVRGLINETESLESVALGRAVALSSINQAILMAAAILCGILLIRARRPSSQA